MATRWRDAWRRPRPPPATASIRPELAERFRQVHPFDQAEATLVEALVRRPSRLSRRHETTLRYALNLARCWVLTVDGEELVVGTKLGSFRDRLGGLRQMLEDGPDIDPKRLGSEAEGLVGVVEAAFERTLNEHPRLLTEARLQQELGRKALVLAVGGGGGCGYAHLGAFALLKALRIEPAGVVGTSIGALLGLFRAQRLDLRSSFVRSLAFDLRYSDLFRLLDAETRYGLPGALRLHLRSGLERFFLDEEDQPRTLGELPIPFVTIVSGVRREAFEVVRPYQREFRRALRRGALGRLLHLRDVITDLSRVLNDLVRTPGALETISLGTDALTQEFDAVDAVGFSMAIPAVLQYDVTRSDPRMEGVLAQLFHREGVDALADGGLVSNVPARIAWEMVQGGRLGTRNGAVVALDCFVPSWGRHLPFLPLQRIAAENVERDRPFAQLVVPYRRVPSPVNVLPRHASIERAEVWGRESLDGRTPFLQKLLEPLSPLVSRNPTFK
ncbi:MAG: patatin-like phospholipase family protein [Myxococcota bacterium]